ncbi:MAG: superoxide dismutase [Bacteroidales bacterium]|jgi:Fe-Mn family superoxide dismutase|nr:superoxide dismutase [Bacteroidales bacterium]
MSFELPALPYAKDALEPYISAKTLEFHYGKHHQTYVTNLNNLVAGSKYGEASLETLIREADGGIYNNAAQVWNHTFYFEQFSATPSTAPTGKLKEAIAAASFGFVDVFVEAFNKAAATLFGSGWVWLAKTADSQLAIIQSSNAGNPLRDGATPLLTIDLWEHAYYLDKQNARAKYIEDFWKILDWKVIENRFA